MKQERFLFDHVLNLVSAVDAEYAKCTNSDPTYPTSPSPMGESSSPRVSSPPVNEPNSLPYGRATPNWHYHSSLGQTINLSNQIPIEDIQTGAKTMDSTTESRPLLPVLPTANRPTHLSSVIYYWPNALAALAKLNVQGNMQHYNDISNVQWRYKISPEHIDKLLNHLIDHGTTDIDGVRHSTKVAWRALCNLENELIAAGAVPGRSRIE